MSMASVGKLGIAVLGLGRMGYTHMKNLKASGRAAIRYLMVNKDINKARTVANEFESPPQCILPSQIDSVLNDQSIDGVFICTPTCGHESTIKAALNSGKSVFCEKPLTDNIDTTRECYNLAEDKGLPLFCAFHRRFDPSFNKVRESVHNGTAGRLRMLRFSSHDPSPPTLEYMKSSGGILSDSTIHDIDLALWMSKSPAKSVYVQSRAFDSDVRDCGDHDLVVVIVTHENGTVTVIDNGRRCSFGYDQRLEALCDDASFIVSNRPTHQLTECRTQTIKCPVTDQSFITRYPDAYAREAEHFLDVLQGEALKVTKEDTLSAMALVQAAKKSIDTGTQIVLS